MATSFNLFKILALASLTLFFGCKEGGPFKQSKTFVGGKTVSADHLNLGYTTYMEYCVQCHGENGEGKGPASKGLIPPPRNFKQGLYKFGRVLAGELPHDEDFYKIIRHGLNGTAMLPWDIGDKRLDAVTQYIKSLAPQVWEDKEANLGAPIVAKGDPFGMARRTHAVKKGAAVYHIKAQCQTCHRAYASKEQIVAMGKEIGEEVSMSDFAEDMYKLKLQETEYGYKALPPDFTWHDIRSASTVEEIYVRLASGVSGTTMPSWKDTIEDNEIWAVAYYVKALMELKDKSGRKKFMSQMSF